MRYCKRCLYPENHALYITFDEHGVCSGCRIHEEKDALPWNEREGKLKSILNEQSNKSGTSYDCIIPITGGGDSYFTVHMITKVYGLNPLLVSYNNHFNTKIGIRNLANLLAVFDCDHIQCTLAPEKVKRITKYSLKKFGSMYWHVLAGMFTFPVQMAVKAKIPLIVWGSHGWTDQVGMFSHIDEVEMTKKLRKEHALMTYDAEDLVNEGENVSRRDVQPFIYPFDEELERVGVRGIYLSNYLRWDSKTQHEEMIKLYGYETAPQQRTFNTYEDVHCFHSAGLHDYLKYLKYGYGKVSDHATREIRFGRMTREEGIDLVKKYESVKPNDMPLFLEWLGITEEELYAFVNPFRDKRIWTKDENNSWRLLDSVVNHKNDEGVDAVRLDKKGISEFIVTPSREPEVLEDEYILMGRGYSDKINYQAIDDDQALIFKNLDKLRQDMEEKFNALPEVDPLAAEPRATSISYCQRCVLPSTKPGVVIDDEGVCSACRSVEKKEFIDWDKRKQELEEICNSIRGSYGNGYECLVPVSGGKDSYYQVWMMKKIQKLHVLAVCILRHLQTKEGIANLNNMVKAFDVDLLRISLKPSVFKSVRKKAFLEKGEPNWADHCSVFAGVARISHMYQIPLTVWGEDIAVEFGGKTSAKSTNSAEDLLNNDLVKGIPIEDFFNEHVVKKNTFFYKAPEKEDMKLKNIRSIYLGYYFNWNGDENFKIAEKFGFQERTMWRLAGHFVNYDNMDEKLCEINLWFKLLKFGFWSTTDELCCEIWNKRMSRDEVINILNEIQYEMPAEYLKDFLEFHQISEEEFWGNVSKYLNRKIWQKVNGKWRVKVPLVSKLSSAVG